MVNEPDDRTGEKSAWIAEAITAWKNNETKLNEGGSLDHITEAEKILQFQFPLDFKDLYQNINGFRDLDWNEHMFSLWPLERIEQEYQRDNDLTFVGFCDFLIRSHCIGFRKDAMGVFKSYDKNQQFVSSFREAIYLINFNPDPAF